MSERTELVQQVRLELRSLGAALGRLNDSVGSAVELKGGDVELLDRLARFGPASPTDLAESLGIHPATMTGILDRLETGGWIVRERHPDDRRKVTLRVLRTRAPDLVRLYSPMNNAIGDICQEMTTDQLAAVRDFLVAIGAAAEASTETVRNTGVR